MVIKRPQLQTPALDQPSLNAFQLWSNKCTKMICTGTCFPFSPRMGYCSCLSHPTAGPVLLRTRFQVTNFYVIYFLNLHVRQSVEAVRQRKGGIQKIKTGCFASASTKFGETVNSPAQPVNRKSQPFQKKRDKNHIAGNLYRLRLFFRSSKVSQWLLKLLSHQDMKMLLVAVLHTKMPLASMRFQCSYPVLSYSLYYLEFFPSCISWHFQAISFQQVNMLDIYSSLAQRPDAFQGFTSIAEQLHFLNTKTDLGYHCCSAGVSNETSQSTSFGPLQHPVAVSPIT